LSSAQVLSTDSVVVVTGPVEMEEADGVVVSSPSVVVVDGSSVTVVATSVVLPLVS